MSEKLKPFGPNIGSSEANAVLGEGQAEAMAYASIPAEEARVQAEKNAKAVVNSEAYREAGVKSGANWAGPSGDENKDRENQEIASEGASELHALHQEQRAQLVIADNAKREADRLATDAAETYSKTQ